MVGPILTLVIGGTICIALIGWLLGDLIYKTATPDAVGSKHDAKED